MLEILAQEKTNGSDLIMYQCGTEKCKPGHYYGPAVRDHFLIHYIASGKGIFETGNKTYKLSAGQGFLICPGIVTYYQADTIEPWNYSWIGFNGAKAEFYLKKAGLCQKTPTFTCKKDKAIENCFIQMLNSKQMQKSKEMRILGYLYIFLSELIEDNSDVQIFDKDINRKEKYVRKIVDYINLNYATKIKINEIANYVGLDRSYMGAIFKEYLNTSPQNYLINLRMNKACELMKDQDLSIGDISRSVGYEDPLLFSKMFKKIKGVPPSEYKKMVGDEGLEPPTFTTSRWHSANWVNRPPIWNILIIKQSIINNQ